MSRKTFSLSAIAVAAIASMSFSGADGAKALAQGQQDEIGSPSAVEEGSQADQTFEIVPLDAQSSDPISFVSNPVTQSLEVESDAQIDPAYQAASLGELVNLVEPRELTDQMHCLAGAVYFESRGEPLAGQLAVAQVVINRSQDTRWPASYCGVVYQRAQFSFVKNGRMPRIRTSSDAWQRATAIAHIAHDGLWESEAGDAVYFHANYVRPKWSRRKQRTTQIDTHIFYR